jgi:phenazine biosynthesis protein phzE
MTGLDQLLGGDEPFALLHRPDSTGAGFVELLTGPVRQLDRLSDLPATQSEPGRHQVLAMLPYCQLAERGFACIDDDTPLLAMTVQDQQLLPIAEVLNRLPERDVALTAAGFDLDDVEYAEIVSRIVTDEIGRGEGSNFVIRRSFTARIENYSTAVAQTLFRRLLSQESGAYWTFLVHTGTHTLVGASPERHLSLRDGLAVMNPISGTYRYPAGGAATSGLLDFLRDDKETGELFMVLDEELKMMAAVCPSGPRVVGPFLKQMSRLAHTEYFIEGRTELPVPELLGHTLFAPTVTGSPVESACRVIARHEPSGRGYYGGALALIGTDQAGRAQLDSAIMIRTAQLDPAGLLQFGVGSTIVRDSEPLSEAAETTTKAGSLFGALTGDRPTAGGDVDRQLADHPAVTTALAARNRNLARFWFPGHQPRSGGTTAGRRVLVIDAEDGFTAMLGQQIGACGPDVIIRPVGYRYDPADFDLVVLGPGPGDPSDTTDPKIRRLGEHLRELIDCRRPVLSICLGHQVLSGHLGLELVRRPVPDQGVQRQFNLFGRDVRVGFYSTFTARSEVDELWSPEFGTVEVSRDQATGQVYGLHGPQLRSYQFHPESILSADGFAILADALTALLPEPAVSR